MAVRPALCTILYTAVSAAYFRIGLGCFGRSQKRFITQKGQHSHIIENVLNSLANFRLFYVVEPTKTRSKNDLNSLKAL